MKTNTTYHTGGSRSAQPQNAENLEKDHSGNISEALPPGMSYIVLRRDMLSSDLTLTEMILCEVIHFREFKSMGCRDSNATLAEFMGTTVGHLKVLLHRARSKGWVISTKSADGNRILQVVYSTKSGNFMEIPTRNHVLPTRNSPILVQEEARRSSPTPPKEGMRDSSDSGKSQDAKGEAAGFDDDNYDLDDDPDNSNPPKGEMELSQDAFRTPGGKATPRNSFPDSPSGRIAKKLEREFDRRRKGPPPNNNRSAARRAASVDRLIASEGAARIAALADYWISNSSGDKFAPRPNSCETFANKISSIIAWYECHSDQSYEDLAKPKPKPKPKRVIRQGTPEFEQAMRAIRQLDEEVTL